MIIRRVELENFISHKSSRVDFEPGITVIVGPNGAGKTSIIDAIMFALFKEHTRGGRLVNLVNRGSSRARVKLVFNNGGVDYIVERIIVRETPSTARQVEVYLYRDTGSGPVLVARGDKRVSEELSKILGVTPKTYTLSVFVKQGEIENLLTAQPAERKKAIGELLGLDKLEKAYEYMRELISYWSTKAAIIGAEASKLKEREERLSKLQEYYLEITEKKKRIDNSLLRIREELEEAKSKLKKLEEKRREKIRLELEVAPRRREVEFLVGELERLEKELAEAQEAKAMLSKKLSELKKLLVVEQGVEALHRLEELKPSIEKLEEIEEELRRLEKEKNSILPRVQEYMKAREQLRSLKEKVNVIESRLREKKALEARISELKQQVNRVKRRIEAMIGATDPSRKVKELEEELRGLEEKRKTYEEILNGVEVELKALNSRVRELEERIKFLESTESNRCPTCGQLLTPSLRARLLDEASRELGKVKDRIRVLESEKKELERVLSRVVEELSAKKNTYSRLIILVEELKSLEEKHVAYEKRLEVLSKEISSYEKEYSRLRDLEERVERLEEYYREMIRIDAKMRELERSRRKLLEDIERARRLEEIVKEAEVKLGVGREKFRELKEKLDVLRSEVRVLEEKASRLDKLRKEYERVKSKLAESRKALSRLEEKLRALEGVEEEYSKTRDRVDELNEEYRRLSGESSRLAGIEQRLREELEHARSEYEKALKAREEKERIDKLVSLLKKIREAYSKDGLQRIIRSKAKELVEYYLKEIVSSFNLNISDVSLDEDFNITVTTPSGEQPVETISGGERVALAIALRLALAKALVGRGVESIILDEPTIHLDEERRRELVRILKTSFKGAREVVPQLIIVTHDRELEDAADTVYQVTRIDGYSRVVRTI